MVNWVLQSRPDTPGLMQSRTLPLHQHCHSERDTHAHSPSFIFAHLQSSSSIFIHPHSSPLTVVRIRSSPFIFIHPRSSSSIFPLLHSSSLIYTPCRHDRIGEKRTTSTPEAEGRKPGEGVEEVGSEMTKGTQQWCGPRSLGEGAAAKSKEKNVGRKFPVSC